MNEAFENFMLLFFRDYLSNVNDDCGDACIGSAMEFILNENAEKQVFLSNLLDLVERNSDIAGFYYSGCFSKWAHILRVGLTTRYEISEVSKASLCSYIDDSVFLCDGC